MCYGKAEFPLRSDARVSEPADGVLAHNCDPGKRRMYRCYVPAEEGVWSPAVHSNCQHNELAAMALRTMGPTPSDPEYDPRNLAHVCAKSQFRKMRVLVKRMGLVPMSHREVAESYKGALGRRYRVALLSLEDEGLEPMDLRLSAFVKGEKFNPTAKISKPRMINPRSPKYNLVLASYLKPLEHALWRKWKIGHLCKPTRVSGKGLNGRERADLIQRKMASVGDCLVFEVDGKAFEAHVTRGQLVAEQTVYKAAYPNDSFLRMLLRVQLGLSGKSASGIRYSREGCRASGDFNTGLGNTILMGNYVIAAMESLRADFRWTVLADGDNCLLFVERLGGAGLPDKFYDLVRSVCAHEMTVEKPTTVLEEVVFGQSQPVLTALGYVMVRSPYKVLSGAFCGYRHYHDRAFAPRLGLAVAQAEMAVNRGVPVLGPYFEEAARLLGHHKLPRDPSYFLEGHLIGVVDPGWVPVTVAARHSFELAFGIGIEEQFALERRLLGGLRSNLVSTFAKGTWLDSVVQDNHGTDLSVVDGLGAELFEVGKQ